MRSTIKEVFPVREAWTLVRPALEEAKLQRLDTLPATEFRPEFRTVGGCASSCAGSRCSRCSCRWLGQPHSDLYSMSAAPV
jgi:hypothetical protein